MVNKIDFKAKNLTSNAGIFLLFENAKSNGIFELQNDPLIAEYDIRVKEPETVSRFLGHLQLQDNSDVQRHQFQSLQKTTFKKPVERHYH